MFLMNLFNILLLLTIYIYQLQNSEGTPLSQAGPWPYGIIPYQISNQFPINAKKLILAMMEKIQNVSCVRFSKLTTENTYLEVTERRYEPCSSFIGYTNSGTKTMYLQNDCMNENAILHEFMHVLGFRHEHNRNDRDNYIRIIRNNIQPKYLHNFRKCEYLEALYFHMSYDFNSVTHCPKYNDFAINKSLPTIESISGSEIEANGLSILDIKKINLYYDCKYKNYQKRNQSNESPLHTAVWNDDKEQVFLYCAKRPQIWENSKPFKNDDSIQRTDNETIQLTCVADHPIKWVLPENEQYQSYSNPTNDGRLTTFYSSGNRTNSTLILTGLQWTDTGFYRCLAIDRNDINLNLELEEKENRIYLYVKDGDPKHLLLHLKDEVISLNHHENDYINCLVTDESANVTFDYHESNLEEKLEYVKKFGFKLPSNSNLSIFGHAVCNARVQKDNVNDRHNVSIQRESVQQIEDTISFTLRVHNPPVDVFIVQLTTNEEPNNDMEYLFYPNSNVTIVCTANLKYKNCKLETPTRNTHTNENGTVFLPIIIASTDSGMYKCSCYDTMYIDEYSNHNHSVERKISALEKKGQITFLKGNVGSWSIDELETIRFEVNVKILMPKGYTKKDIVVNWYHRYSTVMPDSDNLFYEIHMNQGRNLNGAFQNYSCKVNESKSFNENPIMQVGMVVKNATANLSGEYVLSISAIDDDVKFTFSLDVISNPKLQLFVTEKESSDELNSKYLEKDKIYDIWCIAEGIPRRYPTLWFQSCIISISCEKYLWENVIENIFKKTATFQNALIAKVNASKTGVYFCKLDSRNNTEISVTTPFIVSDVRDVQKNQGFGIEVVVQPNMQGIFQHSNVSMFCKMQRYDKYQTPKWYYQSLNRSLPRVHFQSMNGGYYTIRDSYEYYSTKSVLTINNIQVDHSGIYICRSFKITNATIVTSNATIIVLETKPPSIDKFSDEDENFYYARPATIICESRTSPIPKVQWYKNGFLLSDNNSRYSILEHNTVLKIHAVVDDDDGTYECVVSNFAGQHNSTTSKKFNRTVVSIPPDYMKAILATASGLLGLFVVTIVIVVVLRGPKHQKRLEWLEEIRDNLFCSPENDIDINVPLNDQTDNLSFLAEFSMPLEFVEPIQHPKIVLGKGEYGEVVQSILHVPLSSLIVAVKIIKATLPVNEISELLSEVKLMIHAGNHVNVLQLIGTVTSCLGKGKMYMVTEYCKFGSLLHVLQSRRDSFINELLTLNSLIRADNNNISNPIGYLMPVVPRLTATHRCHAQGNLDSNGLCTTDLIYFSCQIANGLEFLSSRNIIHRDLAARNILLTENYLIRISDFGLSREGKVYQLKNYKLKLPFPWMAYESLVNYSFSAHSDIWSFGIVLWEIFTLGQHPFPEYRNADALKKALRNGYRLPKPIYASYKMYRLMRCCWLLKPVTRRPSFTKCKIYLKDELRRFCKDCYNKFDIVLNDPKNQPDYSDLRKKFVDFSVLSPKGYEITNSQTNNEFLRNKDSQRDYVNLPNRQNFAPAETENELHLLNNETNV